MKAVRCYLALKIDFLGIPGKLHAFHYLVMVYVEGVLTNWKDNDRSLNHYAKEFLGVDLGFESSLLVVKWPT